MTPAVCSFLLTGLQDALEHAWPVSSGIQAVHGSAGASLSKGDLRCAILVGSGFSFCAWDLARNLNLLDLRLPTLTEYGCHELLAHQLRQLSLSDSNVQSCLEDPSLQSLSADTMGIPGPVVQLMQAIQGHYRKGHEIGRCAACHCCFGTYKGVQHIIHCCDSWQAESFCQCIPSWKTSGCHDLDV